MDNQSIEIKLSNGETLTATAMNVVVDNGSDYGTYDCVLHYKNKSAQFKCDFITDTSLDLNAALWGFICAVIDRQCGFTAERQTIADKERVNAFIELFGDVMTNEDLIKELEIKFWDLCSALAQNL